jgi:hypothetical protein
MTVRVIMPDLETAAAHVEWRVTKFSAFISDIRPTRTVLTPRKANRNGIILLTFTA